MAHHRDQPSSFLPYTPSEPTDAMTRPSERAESPAAVTISIEAEHDCSIPGAATHTVPGPNIPHDAQWRGSDLSPNAGMVIRAHSFGGQLQAPLSGLRRRALSDSVSFSGMNPQIYPDTFADDDEDFAQNSPLHLSPHWSSPGRGRELEQGTPPNFSPSPHLPLSLPAWNSEAGSESSPSRSSSLIRVPSSSEQLETQSQWGAFPQQQTTLSHFPSSPFSSSSLPLWRSETASETSSIGSVSPVPSHLHLPFAGVHQSYPHPRHLPGSNSENPSHDDYIDDDLEASNRGRSTRRSQRYIMPFDDPSAGGIDDDVRRLEALTLGGGGTSTEAYDLSRYSPRGTDSSWGHFHHQSWGLQLQIPPSSQPETWPQDTNSGSISSSSSRSPHHPLAIQPSTPLDFPGGSLDGSPPHDTYPPSSDRIYSPTVSRSGSSARNNRRRRLQDGQSPYPSPVTDGQPTGLNAQDEFGPGGNTASDPSLSDLSHASAPDAPAGTFSPQSYDQSGQSGPSQSSAIRPVATDATRRASTARRKDPSKRGAFICELCGHDFTAKHNYQNHMNSHNSVKPFQCEKCSQRFVTQHVLKRHDPKCSSRSLSKKRRS
ncbi:hypothetical protein DFH07DRAFT_458255 [Mycena maculata]|uniref:C2H2-type domain-containing protein n=1 Tax=Mycena maculata TaxID=230809 RepID=A0AAD7NEP2_9AGAR|nr:hypothetical protein DFH07DRAFT_458255 [Mycena maculata]